MNYDEEEVLGDSGFNLKEDDDLDETPFNEPLEESTDGFRLDEEEPEAV